MTCETCKFASAYLPPKGKCPPEPKWPKFKWWQFPSWTDVLIFRANAIPWELWMEQEHRAQKKMQCRRFPQPHDRPKTYQCGEFQVRDDG